jgi:hypothetical protein
VYTACWMRKLGHAPVILYSGQDVQRTVEAPGVANRLLSGGFWKLAAQIPDVELVDLDAEPTPDAAAAASFAEFAANYTKRAPKRASATSAASSRPSRGWRSSRPARTAPSHASTPKATSAGSSLTAA